MVREPGTSSRSSKFSDHDILKNYLSENRTSNLTGKSPQSSLKTVHILQTKTVDTNLIGSEVGINAINLCYIAPFRSFYRAVGMIALRIETKMVKIKQQEI